MKASILLFAALWLLAPGVAHSDVLVHDSFDGNSLDWCRWEDTSYKGTVSQSNELSLSPDGTDQFTSARVLSQLRLVGDFDIQADYRFGQGLSEPPTSGGLNVALGVYWDEARQITLSRVRLAGGDGIYAYASLPEIAPNNSLFASNAATAGTLRLARIGNQLNFHYRASTDVQWTNLGAMSVPATPVHITLSAFNSGVLRRFTTYFDNFKLNAGTTDDIEYAPPSGFRKRSDLAIAAVIENYPVHRYWRSGWKPVDFFDYARDNGFEWVKTSVTMVSAPELAATPPEQWGSLPWQNRFWSSREWAAETLRQAAARGLRQEVQLFLSPEAAHWGKQSGPSEWANKTPDEIAPLLEQNVFETVAYFMSQGLNVEKYAIGNEVDIGILDFLPTRRIAVPPGVNFTSDFAWLRVNVWSIEAKLLKAASNGIRRADPAAKIILHIAGLEFTPGNVFAPAFFESMRDFGVTFDYAALSHPYAFSPWKLDRYSATCWFKRLALVANRVSDVAAKPVMFVEASYPSAPGPGILAASMPDFPFTIVGQSAWIREQLRFASGRPNISGWHYFYPDMAANLLGQTAEEQQLASSSLFATDQRPNPGLTEFQVNLDPAADRDGDGIPDGVETAEGLNPLAKDNDIFASGRLFAMQQYRDFLSREGDAAGITYWAGQINAGTQTRAQMVEGYFNSAEFQGVIAPVARLYFAYFLRIPDFGGLNYWIGQGKQGSSLETISNAFATSAEFVNRYGSLTASQFVTLVYQNVLGRAPDAAGLAYWVGKLNGGMTRGQMMAQFSESAEYQALMGSEIYVTMMYYAMLRRSPDQAGFDYWVGYMDKGNPGAALINGFLGAAEYRSRFLL